MVALTWRDRCARARRQTKLKPAARELATAIVPGLAVLAGTVIAGWDGLEAAVLAVGATLATYVAVVGVTFVTHVTTARADTLAETLAVVQAERDALKAAATKRRITVTIHDVSPTWAAPGRDIQQKGGLGEQDVPLLFAQVSICNRDTPTALKDFLFVVELNDGRAINGWFVPEPYLGQALADNAAGRGVPVGRDIRQLTMARAFGNGEERTGWLVGVFLGLTRADTATIAGQKVVVALSDAEGQSHGTRWNAEYQKRGGPTPHLG
jgi:hypothetical protein